MKLIILIAIWLIPSLAYAQASVKATVSANVLDVTSITTNEYGFAEVSGPPPLYCEMQDNTYMCYY